MSATYTEKILSFCVNNPEFDELLSIINEFNPIKILGAHEFEIRHSNVLAWLLNPKAHHGLGDTVFKKLVCEILKGSDSPLQISEILTSDYSDLKLLREWKNIDVLAVSETNKTLVLIENKYNATESDGQLEKYCGIIEKKYPSYKKLLVFLTIDGSLPKGSREYIPFTHSQIHDVIKPIIEIKKSYINDKVYDFIMQYMEVLEDKTMSNEKIAKLCRSLYKEHKEAIELIIEYGKPIIPIEKIKDFHSATKTMFIHGDTTYKPSINKYYTFIPVDWKDVVPATNLTTDKYLIHFWLNFAEYDKGLVYLYLSVGKFPDKDKETRKELLEKIGNKLISANLIDKIPTSTSNTKLLSATINLEKEDLSEYDDIIKLLTEAYNGKFKAAKEILDPIIQEFWGSAKDV